MVMMSMYGHRVTSEDDPYVRLALELMDAATDAITGRWVVDFFPLGPLVSFRFGFLTRLIITLAKYLPFMAFRKKAAAYRARIPDWVDRAFNSFKDNMVGILDPMFDSLPEMPPAHQRRC